MLTAEAFARARDFVLRHARNLDIARFRFHFAGGSVDAVWQQLGYFQNDDGGFGQAIEPDIRDPQSTALGTAMALRIVREVQSTGRSGTIAGAGEAADALVQKALSYLVQTFDFDIGGWRIVPPGIERSPHAPWWRQRGRDDVFQRFSLHPNAELLGYLLEQARVVPPALLETLYANVMERIAAVDDGGEPLGKDGLLGCKRLAASTGLDDEARDDVIDVVSRQLHTVGRGPADWDDNGLRPLHVAPYPASPFYPPLQQLVADNLAYEIATQRADGSWQPTWSWGDDHKYPRVWEAAKFEWAGAITVDTLLVLQRYGKIAPDAR